MDGIFRKMQQRCPLVAGSLWREVCSWTPQGLPTLTLGVCP